MGKREDNKTGSGTTRKPKSKRKPKRELEMRCRMEDVDQTTGKLMRVVRILSGLGEHCTVTSAQVVIKQAEDLLSTVDLHELSKNIDWVESDDF